MCLKSVDKSYKRGTKKPQKWYKIVQRHSNYEGTHYEIYTTIYKRTPIIIGDEYTHNKAKRTKIFYGGSVKDPVYQKEYNKYLTLRRNWDRNYWHLRGNERLKAEKSKPKFTPPKREDGTSRGMYLPMKHYESGFHFYDLEACRKHATTSNMSHTPRSTYRTETRPTNNPFLILECEVTGIHTIGQDRYGRACVAYQFKPIKIVE